MIKTENINYIHTDEEIGITREVCCDYDKDLRKWITSYLTNNPNKTQHEIKSYFSPNYEEHLNEYEILKIETELNSMVEDGTLSYDTDKTDGFGFRKVYNLRGV